MDLKSSNYIQQHTTSFFQTHGGLSALPDPMGKKDEAPSPKCRTGFSFGIGSRKNLPSKWDDAEKWLINAHTSPANFLLKKCGINGPVIKQEELHKELQVVANEQKPKSSHRTLGYVLLKDRLVNHVESTKVIHEVKNRDTGTEMTPVASSAVSPYPTPPKRSVVSPPRHNTPESRLALMDHSSLQLECHLAEKLQPWTPFDTIGSTWSSMEDEEDEISKSLRHFDMNSEFFETNSGPRPSAWEEQEMSEPCLRYQMREKKIQAWVNLQKAKAEAEKRKLEVKIQKMRSKYEEKMMKKMTIVRRKAEELRAAARLDHSEKVEKSHKTPNLEPSLQFSDHRGSCGCLISN